MVFLVLFSEIRHFHLLGTGKSGSRRGRFLNAVSGSRGASGISSVTIIDLSSG